MMAMPSARICSSHLDSFFGECSKKVLLGEIPVMLLKKLLFMSSVGM